MSRLIPIKQGVPNTLFGLSFGDNTLQIARINQLATGKAILDKRTSPGSGAHHQKLLVVNGRKGLVAFLGGLDIHPTRLGSSGWQDCHVQVRGPAARNALHVSSSVGQSIRKADSLKCRQAIA